MMKNNMEPWKFKALGVLEFSLLILGALIGAAALMTAATTAGWAAFMATTLFTTNPALGADIGIATAVAIGALG